MFARRGKDLARNVPPVRDVVDVVDVVEGELLVTEGTWIQSRKISYKVKKGPKTVGGFSLSQIVM